MKAYARLLMDQHADILGAELGFLFFIFIFLKITHCSYVLGYDEPPGISREHTTKAHSGLVSV